MTAPATPRPPGVTPSGLVPLPVRTIVLRSMVVAVLTALAVLVIVGWVWWDGAHRENRSAEALDAARSLTVTLLSHDTADLGTGLATARGLVTGPLAEKFDTVAPRLLVPGPATEPGFRTRAEVVRAAVVSTDSDGAVVLLYVDRVTGSDLTPSYRIADQVTVTVTDADGRWLVSGLDPA